MCGIVSYTGHSQAVPILLDGLSKLEYRAMTQPVLPFGMGRTRQEL